MDKNMLWLNEFTENTTLIQYLNQVGSQITYKENKRNQDAPFLTVLIRTQGKREEGLREAFLCLSAQTNMDFEIIVIGHKASEEGKKIIREVIDTQQEELRQMIRYYDLDEGTRTAPLNKGFSLARGKYIAVFDDDDILFDNWVESFYELAKEYDGRILHSYAFSQNWKSVQGLGYRAETKPMNSYCCDFDLISQMAVNRCPLMTLAFPTNIYQNLGIRFNDSLNVMEDWEYFMRLASIVGVADISNPTAIYRFWQNIESSATLHDQDAWDETYKNIQKSYAERSLIILPKHVEGIIKKTTDDATSASLRIENNESFLYYSKGSSFNDQMKIEGKNNLELPYFDILFKIQNPTDQITALRFDLTEEGMFLLEKITIDVWYTNGECRQLHLEDVVHNGYQCDEGVLFLYEDPEIIWENNDERYLDVIRIYGQISRKISRMKEISLTRCKINNLKMASRKISLRKKGLY